MRAAIIVAVLAVSGCVTPTVTKKPAFKIDFSQFKTVSYRVHPNDQTEYGSGEDAIKYGEETMSLIDILLSARLKKMGHTLVDRSGNPDLDIDVNITAVKPGSGAARLVVGFGAGRAITRFDASFRDSKGSVLAEFEGGRSYTGMGWNEGPLPEKTEISTSAAVRSVEQIETFMVNGGTFPQKEK